jgi:hypothetical protein
MSSSGRVGWEILLCYSTWSFCFLVSDQYRLDDLRLTNKLTVEEGV